MSVLLHRTAIGRVVVGLTLAALALPLALPVGGAAAERAASVTAKRAKPKSGSYRGRTSQHQPVSFKVRQRTVKGARVTIRRHGCTVTVHIHGSDRVSRGRFSVSSSHARLKGRFVTKTKAKGKVTTHGLCAPGSKTVDYTAKRRS